MSQNKQMHYVYNILEEERTMNINIGYGNDTGNDSKRSLPNQYKIVAHEGVMPITLKMLNSALSEQKK